MIDTLGDRMKRYELVTHIHLPIRSYVILRIDGCHFHTYTKHCDKPYDTNLNRAMRESTLHLCENIQGCKLGYTQSDEASFLLTDFDDIGTSAWYDNQLQKIVSVAASTFTAIFNKIRTDQNDESMPTTRLATFDARAFTLPDATEVMNYFIWRIKDSERNSLSGLAQAHYSHKQLEGKKSEDKQEMLFQKGINWNDVSGEQKRGIMITKHDTDDNRGTTWISQAAPMSSEKDLLLSFIPDKK